MVKTGLKPTDELIRLAIIGDGAAFTQLWDTHIDSLRSYIKSILKQYDDFYIDDICSRSFEKAFRQIGSYDPSRAQFLTWLEKIAHNTALDLIKSEQREKRQTISLDEAIQPMSETLEYEVDSPLETIIKDEDKSETERLIDGLSPLYAQVARCRFIEGMQYKEIADELGMELNTVRTRIRRAREKMDQLKDEE